MPTYRLCGLALECFERRGVHRHDYHALADIALHQLRGLNEQGGACTGVYGWCMHWCLWSAHGWRAHAYHKLSDEHLGCMTQQDHTSFGARPTATQLTAFPAALIHSFRRPIPFYSAHLDLIPFIPAHSPYQSQHPADVSFLTPHRPTTHPS